MGSRIGGLEGLVSACIFYKTKVRNSWPHTVDGINPA